MQGRRSTSIERLGQSVSACCRLLERPKVAKQAIIVLLAIHTCLLAYSAYVHSPTLNEPGHLVAGLSHWKFGRFELFRVNPPLVRMVAALPVMAAGYEEDWSGFHEGPGARPVFAMGEDFVAANGERSFFLFMIARWACIPFSWIGTITCYLWARDLYGRPAGIVACTLWCFSPNILAHASLITADAHATALGLAACYTFWRWLKRPTWTQAALTGCVLGMAELTKTTLILFYPLWPLMWVLYRWPDRKCMNRQTWLREAGMLLLRMAIGLYILNLGYGFEGSFKQLKEFHFVSNLFTGPGGAEENNTDSIPQSEIHIPNSINRFADTWLGALPVPFPKNYLLGIDIQQRDFENYGRPSYLCGVWQERGWWYYYLYAAVIKVPLGLWMLGVYALIFACSCHQSECTEPALPRALPNSRHSALDTLCLLTPPLLIFCVVSSKTGFSEHFRYVLPCFPFLFIWISSVTVLGLPKVNRNIFGTSNDNDRIWDRLENRAKGRLASFALSVLLLWSVASSLWIYPHSLSYFNETIGGPLNGPKHLLGSNIDWGQDLRYLKWNMASHAQQSQGQSVHLAYFGYLDPANVGFDSALPCCEAMSSASRRSQKASKVNYQVSVNFVYGSLWPPRDGKNGNCVVEVRDLQSLRSATPDSFAGYSIWGYCVPNDDQ